MSESSGPSTLRRVLIGCVVLLLAGLAAVCAGTVGLVVGQNAVVGSAPADITPEFRGSISAGDRDGTLDGTGVMVFQQMVAERSGPSYNPFRIAAYNFDYHVMGVYHYPLWISVDPVDSYRPNYSLAQSGTGFVWREDGAAFGMDCVREHSVPGNNAVVDVRYSARSAIT